MRVLSLIHQTDAGAGVFAEAARAAGHDVVERSFALGEPPEKGAESFGAMLVFGGGMHVDQEDEHSWLREESAFVRDALAREVPLAGVCLGSQLVAAAAGARVAPLPQPEIGWHEVELEPAAANDPLLAAAPARFDAFGWHSYAFELPPDAVALARSAAGLQAYRVGARAWGLQFHAEVTATTIEGWLSDYGRQEDARAAGLDPEAVRRRSEREIRRWNAFGRSLCERFLLAAVRG